MPICSSPFICFIIALLSILLLLCVGYIVYFRNQTKQNEQRLLSQIATAEQSANRLKSQFIANLSHEIRTPLNAILGHAQLLERDPAIGEEQQYSVKNMLHSSGRLSSLINDLLEIASIESHSMTLMNKDFDLFDMLNGLSNLFEKRCAQKGLNWRFSNHFDTGAGVHGDMGKIRQVLIKLIGNAVKFTLKGQIELHLQPSENIQGGYQFTIDDTGPGITPEQQRTLFQPFEQQQHDLSGVGLGLAIAKNQIELMGGQLELISHPGRGSSMSFTLVLPPAKGVVCQRLIRGRRVKQLTRQYLNKQQQIRILVIDHTEQTQDILSKMLFDVGIVVSVINDGHEALILLNHLPKEQLPRLVFYDIDVPLQKDVQQLADMQHTFADTNMQFVVLSAPGVQGQIKTGLALTDDLNQDPTDDFQNFIAKPYRFEAVYEQIHQLLNVEFDYQSEQPKPQATPIDFTNCHLSQSEYQQMKQAAHDYEVAKLEEILANLAQREPNDQALAKHLQTFLSHYDMEGLLAELTHLTHIQ